MNSFADTNVAIAYIFSINSLNNKSMAVFREYDNIYWPKLVKREYKKVFKNKRKILVKSYKDLDNVIKLYLMKCQFSVLIGMFPTVN